MEAPITREEIGRLIRTEKEMPLDGTEMFENPALAKLWEVECMLATEDQWCKGRLHDRRGRHCLVGAITEANARQELTRPIIRAIKELSGKHYWRIELFNDDPATNHQDVLRVLQRARLILFSELANADQPRAWYLKLYDKIVTEVFGIQSSDYSGFRPRSSARAGSGEVGPCHLPR